MRKPQEEKSRVGHQDLLWPLGMEAERLKHPEYVECYQVKIETTDKSRVRGRRVKTFITCSPERCSR